MGHLVQRKTELSPEAARLQALSENVYLGQPNVPFNAERKTQFLEAVGRGASATRAAAIVGVSRRNVYYARAADEAFRAAWAEKLEEQADGYEDRLYELSQEPKTAVPAVLFALKSLRGGTWHDYRQVEVLHSADGFRLVLPEAAVEPMMALLKERLPDQVPRLSRTVVEGKATEITNDQGSEAQSG